MILEDNGKKHFYLFDKVIESEKSQKEMFNYTLKCLKNRNSKKENVLILALGSKGSGKSYSLFGKNWTDLYHKFKATKHSDYFLGKSILKDQNKFGIIPRLIADLFVSEENYLRQKIKTLKMSFIKIENDHIYDLLSNKASDILYTKAKAKSNKFLKLSGLKELKVDSLFCGIDKLIIGYQNYTNSVSRSNKNSNKAAILLQLRFKVDRQDISILICNIKSKNETLVNKTLNQHYDLDGLINKMIGEEVLNSFEKPIYQILNKVLDDKPNFILLGTLCPEKKFRSKTLNTLEICSLARKIGQTQFNIKKAGEQKKLPDMENKLSCLKNKKLSAKKSDLDIDKLSIKQKSQKRKQYMMRSLVNIREKLINKTKNSNLINSSQKQKSKNLYSNLSVKQLKKIEEACQRKKIKQNLQNSINSISTKKQLNTKINVRSRLLDRISVERLKVKDTPLKLHRRNFTDPKINDKVDLMLESQKQNNLRYDPLFPKKARLLNIEKQKINRTKNHYNNLGSPTSFFRSPNFKLKNKANDLIQNSLENNRESDIIIQLKKERMQNYGLALSELKRSIDTKNKPILKGFNLQNRFWANRNFNQKEYSSSNVTIEGKSKFREYNKPNVLDNDYDDDNDIKLVKQLDFIFSSNKNKNSETDHLYFDPDNHIQNPNISLLDKGYLNKKEFTPQLDFIKKFGSLPQLIQSKKRPKYKKKRKNINRGSFLKKSQN